MTKHTHRTLLSLLTLAVLAGIPALAAANDNGDGPAYVVAEDAQIERVVGGFAFTEGPVAVKDHKILFTDIPNEQILAYYSDEGRFEVYRNESGAANGLWFNVGRPGQKGRVLACEGGNRRMVRYNHRGQVVEVLAEEYEGNKLNSPNDLTVDAAGGIYFSDPRYGDRSDMEMDVEAVYYISPGGELTRVIDDLEKPNGLILSQDEQTLYVVDNGAENVWAYDVAGPGELENGRVFSDMSSGPRSGGGDGMTLDRQGNVYVAGSKDVWVWTPEGDLIQRIAVPEGPSNCTFGGPDRGTLYITARSSLYRIDTKVQGAR